MNYTDLNCLVTTQLFYTHGWGTAILYDAVFTKILSLLTQLERVLVFPPLKSFTGESTKKLCALTGHAPG